MIVAVARVRRDTLIPVGARDFMQVRVLFFGILKDLTGTAQEVLEVPEQSSVGEAVEVYVRRIPQLRQLMPSLAVSVNREYASPETKLNAGDEIGLLPPVSG